MKIPTRKQKRGLTFNVTPLIDIIFLLIIFFLAASHLARSESAEKVDLPEASQTDEEPQPKPRRLLITMKADGQMQVGGRAVESYEVEQMILEGKVRAKDRGFEVRIRGDRSVDYRTIEPLMLACARSGVTNVGFAVIPK